jgi:hypothetical protein
MYGGADFFCSASIAREVNQPRADAESPGQEFQRILERVRAFQFAAQIWMEPLRTRNLVASKFGDSPAACGQPFKRRRAVLLREAFEEDALNLKIACLDPRPHPVMTDWAIDWAMGRSHADENSDRRRIDRRQMRHVIEVAE